MLPPLNSHQDGVEVIYNIARRQRMTLISFPLSNSVDMWRDRLVSWIEDGHLFAVYSLSLFLAFVTSQ